MKKNIITIMMAFAALFMTQCKKQAEQQANEPAGATMEVTLRVETNTDKTQITSTGLVTWKRGDKICIVGTEQGLLGSVFAVADGDNVVFEGKITPLSTDQILRFYYVGDKSFTLDADGNYTFDISRQDGTLEGIAAHNQLMFGMSEEAVHVGTSDLGTITLNSLMAVAHMNIAYNNNPVTPVTVRGFASSTFNAKTFDGTSAIPGTAGTITMKFTEPAVSTDCYLALLPGRQTLRFNGIGGEYSLSAKDVDANAFYNGNSAIQVPLALQYVDLGLPSGLLWATYNVGATSPEEYGDYFAFGATTTWYETGYAQENPQTHWKDGYSDGYTWAHCPNTHGIYSDENKAVFTKYVKEQYASIYGYNGFYDNKSELDIEEDAARANWGNGWRLPTWENNVELITKCDWEWCEDFNGVSGMKVMKKLDHSKFIFLPAAGYRYEATVGGSSGNYLSSNANVSEPWGYCAYIMSFTDHPIASPFSGQRCHGFSVRPVRSSSY